LNNPLKPIPRNINVPDLPDEVSRCFLIGNVDREDFFLDTQFVKQLPLTVKWEDIAVEIGLFKSKSEARNNKFMGEIPEKYTEGTAKGGKIFVFIHKESQIKST
jgi:hypothetical protein